MPTYDYACEACGHSFDHFQSMTSRKLRKCPECRKPKLVRLVGAGAGLIFRGSGFYETDYKRSGSGGSEGGDSGSEKESSSKSSDAKGDTTPSGEKPSGESKAGGSSKQDAGADSDQ